MDYATLVKGKGLVLVTGKKGSGKSHFVTKIISDIKKQYPDHPIFADITGIKIDGVEPSPSDWRDAPNNCTIVYDEAQLLPWADNSSTKISSDPRVANMTLIRKQNKNIVLITQDPMFIHSVLRKLVDYHYHISHPFKDGKPKVFYFHGAMDTIDPKGYYQQQAMETFTHVLDKETSKLYESIEPDAKHDQVKKYPKKVIYMICFVVFLLLLGIPAMIWGVSKVGGFIFNADKVVEDAGNQAANATGSDNPLSSSAQTLQGGVSGFNVNQMDVENQRIYYRQKAEQKYLNPYTVEVAEFDTVRPAIVAMMGKECRAYNQFGDLLNIDDDLCKSMLKEFGVKPRARRMFNEYQSQEQDLVNEPVTTQTTPVTETTQSFDATQN